MAEDKIVDLDLESSSNSIEVPMLVEFNVHPLFYQRYGRQK